MPVIASVRELPENGRLMAIDHGTRRIGLAITDSQRRMAQPLEVLSGKKLSTNLARIAQLADEHFIAAFIIGYPLEMDGREGPRCQSVRAFVRHLEGACDLPSLYWDERLSSAAAKDALADAHSRTRSIDAAAAALILDDLLTQMS